MNSATRQLRLHLRNWRLILASFWVPIFLLVPMAIFVTHRTQAPNGLTLMTLIGLICSAAFFLATAQQEMLHRSFTFLLPGFRRSLLTNQVAGIAISWVGTLVLTMLLPVAGDVAPGNFLHAWSFGCLAASLFALVLLLVFRFPYSSWLPFNAVWMLFLVMRFWVRIPGEAIIRVLDQSAVITAVTALIVYLVIRNMGDPNLHRVIIERPYISIVDLKNSAKIEQFKQARALQKGGSVAGMRPFAGLLGWAAEKTARAMAAGRHSAGLVWEAVYLQLATGIPRSRVRLSLLILVVPVFALVMGYLDSRISSRDDTGLVGWFPGLVFTVSYYPALAFAYIKTIDPNNGFATTNYVFVDLTATPIEWADYSLSLAIDVGLIEGAQPQFFQIGFSNTATLYEASANFYDNVVLEIDTVSDVPNTLLSGSALGQNYPNPFNPSTRIDFSLEKAGSVELSVYDVAGRKVASLEQGNLDAGNHHVVWNGKTDAGDPAPTGRYNYVLRTAAGQTARSMILLK